jgi:hypothetical protein
MNCLRPGHFVKQCKSAHRCRQCQKPHHTLLHFESEQSSPSSTGTSVQPVTSNAAAGLTSNSLLMTCRVLIDAPGGSSIEARALLDSASSASFVSERLTRTLCLSRSHRNTKISGVAGLSRNFPLQSVANFKISPMHLPNRKFEVSAVVPRVTFELPLQPVSMDSLWKHLEDIHPLMAPMPVPGSSLSEYVATLRRYTKWHQPKRNVQVGDVVLQEDNVIPAKWPLARVVEVHPRNDGLVRAVTIKTSTGDPSQN